MPRPMRAVAAVVALAAAITACTTPSSPPEPNPPVVVDRLVSVGDGSIRLRTDTISVPRPIAAPGASTTTTPPVSGPRIVVDADQRRQEVDGFGAALTDSSAYLLSRLPAAQRTKALTALFAPDTGAGLSVVRLVIGSSDFARSHYTYDDSATPDPTLSRFSIDHDRSYLIPMAREIRRINPDVQFMASPWSAPAWMKDSNDLTFGRLLPEHEPAYARYLVRFLQDYRKAGIAIRYLTVQNEPEFAPRTYPGMEMSAAQQGRFIGTDLARALDDAGVDTRVLVFDHNWDHPGYPLEVLRAPGVAEVAGGVAFHCYKGDQAPAQERIHRELGLGPRSKIWQTECSGGNFQGTRSEAFFGLADLMIGGLQHWGNASLLWNLALDPGNGPRTGGCGGCRGVLVVEGARWKANVDLDVLTHLSRWTPPGSVQVRSEVSEAPEVTAAAVRTGGERIVLVVANPGAARTVTVEAGRLQFRVALRARSLTTLRWPA